MPLSGGWTVRVFHSFKRSVVFGPRFASACITLHLSGVGGGWLDLSQSGRFFRDCLRLFRVLWHSSERDRKRNVVIVLSAGDLAGRQIVPIVGF